MRKSIETFLNTSILEEAGMSTDILKGGIEYIYYILDLIDHTLIANGSYRLSQMMELANLSTFIGNLFAAGLANASNGSFEKNSPHKYPDLLGAASNTNDIEIKVALEDNKPKGHLAKSGYYLTCRYILGDKTGCYSSGKRGDIVWIWEVRFGYLDENDFNKSNTEGDSGKTAVVNKSGMEKLKLVYCDLDSLPFSPKGKLYKTYHEAFVHDSEIVQ